MTRQRFSGGGAALHDALAAGQAAGALPALGYNVRALRIAAFRLDPSVSQEGMLSIDAKTPRLFGQLVIGPGPSGHHIGELDPNKMRGYRLHLQGTFFEVRRQAFRALREVHVTGRVSVDCPNCGGIVVFRSDKPQKCPGHGCGHTFQGGEGERLENRLVGEGTAEFPLRDPILTDDDWTALSAKLTGCMHSELPETAPDGCDLFPEVVAVYRGTSPTELYRTQFTEAMEAAYRTQSPGVSMFVRGHEALQAPGGSNPVAIRMENVRDWRVGWLPIDKLQDGTVGPWILKISKPQPPAANLDV